MMKSSDWVVAGPEVVPSLVVGSGSGVVLVGSSGVVGSAAWVPELEPSTGGAGAGPQAGRRARASRRRRGMAHRAGSHTFLNFHNRQIFCWK